MQRNPQLAVTLARGFHAEQTYIFGVLLSEFLGLSYAIAPELAPGAVATVAHGGRELRLPQTLFAADDDRGLAGNYPPPSCGSLSASAEGLGGGAFDENELPILFGAPQDGRWIGQDGDTLTVHADLLGSSFFALTRLEEVGAGSLDVHGRFPPEQTVAHAHGFLSRPIVDEYTEVLWHCLRRLWPELERKSRVFTVEVSHDVDHPMAYDHASIRDRLWAVRHDASRRILPSMLGSRTLNGLAAVTRLPHRDPFANFGWLMELDEAAGVRGIFYFLAGGQTPHDGRYAVGSRRIRRLLCEVSRRGHEIGLHASYATLDAPDLLRQEYERLARVLDEEGLTAEVRCVRQHYLRWRAPETWRVAEDVGLLVDASAGYSTAVGFRAGTSFEYPVFDAALRRPLRLRERPLHVMDRALSNLPLDQGLETLDSVRRSVARHGGGFEVLWHNDTLAEDADEVTRYRSAISTSGS